MHHRRCCVPRAVLRVKTEIEARCMSGRPLLKSLRLPCRRFMRRQDFHPSGFPVLLATASIPNKNASDTKAEQYSLHDSSAITEKLSVVQRGSLCWCAIQKTQKQQPVTPETMETWRWLRKRNRENRVQVRHRQSRSHHSSA